MAAFTGIRYARAPRLGMPVAEDLPECVQEGELLVCPQNESRLGGVWGPRNKANPFSEDCLRLSIFTPDDGAHTHPVIVWICGGSFVTGSGLFARYDGTTLSHDCGAVVVCVSYRVGALGFLPGEGTRPGIQDQICALRWVQKNISRFGGDPARVTAAAQSAGAYALACHISSLREPLFSKAILFSAPLGLSMSTRDGARVKRLFDRSLGEPFGDAPIGKILEAQERTVRNWRGFVPFLPAGSDPFPVESTIPELQKVLLCCQRDDASPYVNKMPRIFRKVAEPIVTAKVFRAPMMRYANDLERCGVASETRIFNWRPDNGGLGACHTLELPLLFGNWECWCMADMLRGVTKDEFEERGKCFRREIAEFIR